MVGGCGGLLHQGEETEGMEVAEEDSEEDEER